ncbi:GDSL esterase/lipase 1-like isoform X2 [Glycine soja]|uniref:GDSL esterase/lipase 1 isoform X2 n=1 Tax=Glycine max TaxID=3847 RepID=UPI0007191C13|nr:GDSL esterase/lipase 1 isoform X2 [Glycine max]XP_028203381.1 GDSL esterase/lipase 1-like isoform X2 [Glycine soja]|eukprot:XP_014622979.1 GDSL esterase/lipase 1 isoform X2 [Glycine max]
MAGSISLLEFSLVIFIQIMTHCHSSITTCLPEKHAALFILGDSLFDNGNNNYINTTTSYQANYPPYGETFFKYPSGRFSDGRMIPDAVGGAGALRETSQGMVIDLKTQVSYLKNVKNLFSQRFGHAIAEEILSKSVYLFNIGANDYGSLLDPNSTSVLLPVDHQGFVDIVIGNLTDAIKEIYNIGGKKFGFLNVPPIGCSPAIRILVNNGSTCFEEFSAIARLHNNALSKRLHELEKQLKGFKYSVMDFYSAFSQVFNNPTKYGFKVASVGCCGSGPYRGVDSCGGNKGIKEYELCDNVNEHLFFDSHHLTDRASEYFAELIWNANRTVTSPYNLKQLFEL